MTNRIKGKTALITGASSGIGKEVAKLLANFGVNLILIGRRKKRLKNLKKTLSKQKIKIKIIKLDLTKKKRVKKKIQKLLDKKRVDILINNAGLALGLESLDQGDFKDWEKMIDTNIKSLLYVTKYVFSKMKEQNSGDIINLGSIAGEVAYPGGNVYCATKAAVAMLSEALNVDSFGTNIRVSNIAPGAVETEFSHVRFKGDLKKAAKVYEGYEPLKAEDIANLIVYILNTPPHVNIQYARIMPTAQRNPYLLSRKSLN
jgi:NADP-dependent 3-hydroxy acid dehydrogenase YdfG